MLIIYTRAYIMQQININGAYNEAYGVNGKRWDWGNQKE